MFVSPPMADQEEMCRKKNANFPASRIKKIMLSNEDIGKITPSTPVVLGRALELFLTDILTEAAKVCKGTGGTKIGAGDIQAVIDGNERYGFLKIGAEE